MARHSNSQEVVVPGAPAGSRLARQRAGRLLRRGAAGASLALFAAGVAMVGGCAGPNVVSIHDEAEFQRVVLEAGVPAMRGSGAHPRPACQ
jgi:hypothetical protein